MILLNLFNVRKVAYDNFNNKRRYDDDELTVVAVSPAVCVNVSALQFTLITHCIAIHMLPDTRRLQALLQLLAARQPGLLTSVIHRL